MLPRIAALAGRRRIVYLLATNHIERFDDAISRPGRFDLVLPVLPPTLKAKLVRWTGVAERLAELGLEGDDLPKDVAEGLADLTFLEFSALAPELAKAKTQTKLEQIVQSAVRKSTMRQTMSSDEDAVTWKVELSLPAVVDRIRVSGPS
jgi:SpoVK/Ycf46/Vps4 family AAA+-type ATPase